MPIPLPEDAQRIYDSLPPSEQEYLNWLADIIGEDVIDYIYNEETDK